MLDALGWARDLATAGDAAAVGRVLATACHSTKVWLAPIDEAREVPTGRLALARGAPLVQRSHDLPAPLGGPPASPMWLLAVPDGRPQTRSIAFLVRPGSLRFWAHLRSAAPRDYLLQEWDYGGYERELDVPDGFGSGVEASLANGQLAIRVLRGDSIEVMTVQPSPLPISG